MAKDPAFLFYSADFIVGTYEMTDEQVGRYIRLMCLQHQKGHLSESVVLSVMGGEIDREVIGKLKRDDDGLYYNERLDEETSKRREYSKSRAKNRKGNAVSKSCDNHMSNICASQDKHMENENENENKDVNSTTKKDIYPILFDAFWSAYPKHAAKADAQKAFKALNPNDEIMQTILTAIETWRKTDDWTKDGGKFVPLPATYIRGKRWEDELPKTAARPSKEVGAHRYDQRQYTEDQLDAGTNDLVAEALRVREAAK